MPSELGKDGAKIRYQHGLINRPERPRVPTLTNDPDSGSGRFLSRFTDRVAEVARRSHYFMGRRPRIIYRPVDITDQEYQMGGSNAYKFRHFLRGAIYVSTRHASRGGLRK